MAVTILSIQPTAPLALRLTFSDQTWAVIDFEPVLAGKLLGPLRVEADFAQATLEPGGGGVVWPNGARFTADVLHRWGEHLGELKAAARRGIKQELKDEWAAVRLHEEVLAECGPFVSVSQAAQHGGMRLTTLATAIKDGRFPALPTASGMLVRLSAVDKRVGLHNRPGRPRRDEQTARMASRHEPRES